MIGLLIKCSVTHKNLINLFSLVWIILCTLLKILIKFPQYSSFLFPLLLWFWFISFFPGVSLSDICFYSKIYSSSCWISVGSKESFWLLLSCFIQGNTEYYPRSQKKEGKVLASSYKPGKSWSRKGFLFWIGFFQCCSQK